MSKFNLGDRVVVVSYGPDPKAKHLQKILGQAGTVIDLPWDDEDWYDVRLDNPVLNIQSWLCEEGELSAES